MKMNRLLFRFLDRNKNNNKKTSGTSSLFRITECILNNCIIDCRQAARLVFRHDQCFDFVYNSTKKFLLYLTAAVGWAGVRARTSTKIRMSMMHGHICVCAFEDRGHSRRNFAHDLNIICICVLLFIYFCEINEPATFCNWPTAHSIYVHIVLGALVYCEHWSVVGGKRCKF